MSKPISYTPPDAISTLDDASNRPVRIRHVFYLPGYDPEARSRYRVLFVRELMLYAKRFGGSGKREIGRAGFSADGRLQSWSVAAHPQTRGAELRYNVLHWDDIIKRDFARRGPVTLTWLAAATMHMLATGALPKLFRAGWKCGCIIIFPFVTTVLLGALMGVILLLTNALLAAMSSGGSPPPLWISISAGALAGIGCLRALRKPLEFLYYWQLANDLTFNWQHAQGHRRDYDDLPDVFAAKILESLKASQENGSLPDEVLIIGHSTGAVTAIEVAARLIARDPEIGARTASRPGVGAQPVLSLVTLGSGMPVVAMQKTAARIRADIASLVTCRRITWVDYVAPQDWLNFPRFNPIFDLGLPLAPGATLANPTIRSPCFRNIIDEKTYRSVRFRPFRMHFQFLMANDRSGAYDFFAMTSGPQTLRARVLGERSAPSATVETERETVAA